MTNPSPFENILLIQLRRIGDVLMTTPAVRALRQQYPHAKITFLTEAPAHQVLEHNPYLSEVWRIAAKSSFWQKLKLLWQIRKKNFDLVIDFFGNPRSAQITWISGAKKRLGFAFRGRKWAYSEAVVLSGAEQYAALHKLELLAPLGISSESLTLDFFIHESDREYARQLLLTMGVGPQDFLVTLSPVSRQPYKVWPTERFAQVADWLIRQYQAKILFIYGPGEEHFVYQVRVAMTQTALPNYPPPSLAQTKAIFELAQLHLGNDNGPCHFAIAAQIPTVAVFGKPKSINWTPPGQTRHKVVEYDPGCKNACTYPQCQHLNCINGITIPQVQSAVEKSFLASGRTAYAH